MMLALCKSAFFLWLFFNIPKLMRHVPKERNGMLLIVRIACLWFAAAPHLYPVERELRIRGFGAEPTDKLYRSERNEYRRY